MWLVSDWGQDLNRSVLLTCLHLPDPEALTFPPTEPHPGDLPAQNMLSVVRIRVEALHTERSTMGTLTTCRTLGCASVGLAVHVSLRLPQPVTRPLCPAWSNL